MLKDEETHPGVKYLHFPIANNVEQYDISCNKVRRWLNEIIKSFENGEIVFPVLIHCFKGKDRTGVVIAALLKIIGVPNSIIVNEFMLSNGVDELDIVDVLNELDKKGEKYYRDVKFEKVRSQIIGNH